MVASERPGAPGSQATQRHVSCHGRVGTKMNLGSVETFSGLDGMLVTVMVKYERRCVTDEGCSLIVFHAGPCLTLCIPPMHNGGWKIGQ